jgi:hypothetical protein
MPPKRTNNHPLLKDLLPFTQASIQAFYKVQDKITCTKCITVGSTYHVRNSPSTPSIPIFECTSCKYKPLLAQVEKEIKQAVAQIGLPTQEPATNNNTPQVIFSSLPAGLPIVTPLSTNGQPINFGDTNTTFSASTPKPAKASKVVTGAKRQRPATDTTSAPNTGQLNERIATLEATLAATLASFQAQLQQAANKYAALEQKFLEQEKKATLLALDQQEQQQQQQSQQPAQQLIVYEDEDMCMDDPIFDTPITTTTTNITNTGSSLSKWASVASTPINNTEANFPRLVASNKYPNKTKNIKKNNNQKKNNNINIQNNSNSTTKTSLKKKVVTPLKIASAVRAFTAPSTSKPGFSYVYYPAKSRLSRKIQRKNLAALGVTNNRILDIHYPSRNVVALLVHNDYRSQLIETLNKQGLQDLSDYSPLHPTAISDPQFKDLPEAERSIMATTKHNERIIRSLPFIKLHIGKAVARFFEEEGLITSQQLEDYILFHNTKKQTINNTTSNTNNRVSTGSSQVPANTLSQSQQTTTEITL